MASIRSIGQIALLSCLFVPTVVFKLAFWIWVIRRHKSNVTQVPGPRFAAWSRLWIARALKSGRSHEIWMEVNRKFGEYIDLVHEVNVQVDL